MSQWVPKTAWRRTNLTKTYGPSMLGLAGLQKRPGGAASGSPVDNPPPPWAHNRPLATPNPDGSHGSRDERLRAAAVARLRLLYKQQAPFIDVRDASEIERDPVLPYAVPLHVHDLLSGACEAILPRDKGSDIVVFGSVQAPQRAVNAFNALRAAGYRNAAVASVALLRDVAAEAAPPASTAAATAAVDTAPPKRREAKSMVALRRSSSPPSPRA